MSKLTLKQVTEIKHLAKHGPFGTQAKLAQIYGVSQAQISRIVLGKCYLTSDTEDQRNVMKAIVVCAWSTGRWTEGRIPTHLQSTGRDRSDMKLVREWVEKNVSPKTQPSLMPTGKMPQYLFVAGIDYSDEK